MATFILIGYFSILTLLSIYGGHRWYMTRTFNKNAWPLQPPARNFEELPLVTVQLPVFNEALVIERLIDAAVAIDYPREKLQIQVLDDSTDETQDLAKEKVRFHAARGVRIEYLHREDRTGFKAGALDAGMDLADGAFIAIFDADFVPDPQFLKKTIHHFTEPEIGMVQARWEHLNRALSTLTQVQGIILDAHFIIEHGGRSRSNCFFNFNGTAGIWRKRTIVEAGGWQHDTLTEDLDLSYRAQLEGWRFLFVPDITCPAELPATVNAFKTQQHRWAKGSIQVMQKLLPRIWKSPVPFKVKLEASFHLTGNLAYILMLINCIFFVIPSMVVRENVAWWVFLIVDGPLFCMLSLPFIHFYLTAQRVIFQTLKGRKRFIPALMAIGIGLGVNNSRAVCEALLGKESPFVRTPKSGSVDRTLPTNQPRQPFRLANMGWGMFEVILGIAYSCGILWAILHGKWVSIPFLVLFQNGFFFMGWLTLSEQFQQFRVRSRA